MNEHRDEIDRLVIAAYAIVIILMLIRYPLLESFIDTYPWSEIWYTSIQALLMGFAIDDGKPLKMSRETFLTSSFVSILIVSFTTFTLAIWILNISIFTTFLLPVMAITFLIFWFVGIFLRRRYRMWSRQVQTEQ